MAHQRDGCHACGAPFPPAARWCGRCGAARRGPRRAGAVPSRRGVALAAGAVAVAGLGLTMLVDLGSSSPQADAPVELDPDASSGPEHRAAPASQLCTRVATTGPCGPTVVDDRHEVTAMTPVGLEALIVVRRDGTVARVALADGRTRWSEQVLPTAGMASLHASDATLLAAAGGTVVRLDPISGRVRWLRDVGEVVGDRAVRVTAMDGGVIVLGADGRVAALDRDDGGLRWQAEAPGGEAVLTAAGLLTIGREGSVLWHPEHGAVWERPDVLKGRTATWSEPAEGPLPMRSGEGLYHPSSPQGLFDAATGRRLADLAGDPTLAHVAGPVTLQLRWPPGHAPLEITAFGAGGQLAWVRDEPTVSCCLPTVASAGASGVAIVSQGGDGVLLSLADGHRIASVEPPAGWEQAQLQGIAGGVALWRAPAGLVGASLDGTGLVLVAPPTTEVLALEPLLLADGARIVSAGSLTGRTEPPGRRER